MQSIGLDEKVEVKSEPSNVEKDVTASLLSGQEA